MDNITHKIRFKSGEKEIEVTGTQEHCERWFVKLHHQLATGKTPKPCITDAPSKIVDGIMEAAYDLQEIHGKPNLVSGDIKEEMKKAGMKVPSASGLSAAIGNNVKKGYLERTGKVEGKQKAFCITAKGKRYVESGFGKVV